MKRRVYIQDDAVVLRVSFSRQIDGEWLDEDGYEEFRTDADVLYSKVLADPSVRTFEDLLRVAQNGGAVEIRDPLEKAIAAH